jgi:protein phosphatase PTC2/3
MQGWRISMEDAHSTVLDLLPNDSDESKKAKGRLAFFGVFDGHGGDKVALFAGEHIHEIITKQATFKEGNYEQALKDGFLATDRAILNGTISGTHSHPLLRTGHGRWQGRYSSSG